ncbi:MAG: Hsp20/alpha crystallin family protein [Desulfobacterales bacterium]|jgi:HSP20 family protein|nr:Hsp20/alpha crystallin family protein [Desulfobacterales bacterium]
MMEMYKWDPWWEDVLPFDNCRKAARNDKADAPVAVEEDNNEYIIKAKMPEFRKEEISVTVDHGLLKILAEHDADKSTGYCGSFDVKPCHCSICRSFSLPAKIDAGAIKASMKDGVLKLEIPKANGCDDREINIVVH